MFASFRSVACVCVVLVGVTGVLLAGENDRVDYVETFGVREFSGEMIARPIQRADWLRRGLNPADADKRIAAARTALNAFEIIEYVPQTDEYVFKVPEGQDESSVARRLMTEGVFQYVEPNWILFPLGCPDDPRFGQQWHHSANRMQSCDGWDLHSGDPATSVGICDTGVRTTHEDLQRHRLEGYNAVDRKWESQGGNVNDINGHGTATTGSAAANGNNGVGVSGVGWDLGHRMLRVSNSPGGGASLTTLNHAARTAIESGDKVASISYTGVTSQANRTSATYIKSIGGLMVWAAGNDNRNLNLADRDDDDLIVVGATDQSDRKAGFSAWGRFVDLVAPGVSVYTTRNNHDAAYGGASGTSFSCPLAAGLATLIWSGDPSLTPDEVEEILKEGCDDLGAPGIDEVFGYGRINVYDSMTLVMSNDPAACCFNDGSCQTLSRSDCVDEGGRWNNGKTCDKFQCPQPGACCIDDNTCEIIVERDCLTRGGVFIGEGKSCKRACPCDLVKKLKAKCTGGGTIKATVKFKNKSRDGEKVKFQVGEQLQIEVTIKGKKAKLYTCCFSGPIEVSLIDPQGCKDPIVVNCPD